MAGAEDFKPLILRCHYGDLFDIGSDRFYVPYDLDLSDLLNAGIHGQILHLEFRK